MPTPLQAHYAYSSLDRLDWLLKLKLAFSIAAAQYCLWIFGNDYILLVIIALLLLAGEMVTFINHEGNLLWERDQIAKLEAVEKRTKDAKEALDAFTKQTDSVFSGIELRMEGVNKALAALNGAVGSLDDQLQNLKGKLEALDDTADFLFLRIRNTLESTRKETNNRIYTTELQLESAKSNVEDLERVVVMLNGAVGLLGEQLEDQREKLTVLAAESDALPGGIRNGLRSIQDCFQIIGESVGKQMDQIQMNSQKT
ncbi:hypothetical protein FPV67DRAFT_1462261 [Lyophyllum atratum]|nr:hypothetical protein FPV67DRAFT_1462261 [Lyophyllum atratum]